jgi:hypothetical protein
MKSPLLTIDVAHPPRHPDVVEHDLREAVRRVQQSPSLRILKVIHGYGSSGKGGSTRTVVRNWAYTQRRLLRATIEGAHYSLFDPAMQAMRMAVGEYDDPDLRLPNEGITVIWVK